MRTPAEVRNTRRNHKGACREGEKLGLTHMATWGDRWRTTQALLLGSPIPAPNPLPAEQTRRANRVVATPVYSTMQAGGFSRHHTAK